MYSTKSLIAVLVTASSLLSIVDAHASHSSGSYRLTDDLSYENFFSAFDFFTGPDPTNGFVQFQNQASAIAQGLIGYYEDTKSVFLGVDYTTKDPKGRASLRLESTKSWNHGLLIADIRHMPSSTCGPWPAFWLLSASEQWPVGGEIDILEGVNDYETNAVTLHTSTGCVVNNASLPNSGTGLADDNFALPFSGQMTTSNCDVKAQGQSPNVGCSIHAPKTLSGTQMGQSSPSSADDTSILASYGTPFNNATGGIYATEWTDTYISVWFFPRSSPSFEQFFPSNVTTNSTSAPDPSQWGTPMAHFTGQGCDFSQRFKDLKIIFDTTFCGEWAGREWESGGCKAKTGVETCQAYVQDIPEAFTEAYWEIGGLRWYQKDEAKEVKRRTRKYT